MNTEIFNRKKQKISRRSLKNQMTKAEIIFWSKIKKRQLGYKFRRQYGIGKYIVDFYCPELKFIVEIDGDPHFIGSNILKDKIREDYFKKLGLKIARYNNLEIERNLENVLDNFVKKITPPKSSPSKGEEGEEDK